MMPSTDTRAEPTIRAATPPDAADIVRINVLAWRQAYTGIVPDDVLADVDVTDRVARLRQWLHEPAEAKVLVSVEDGRMTGYVNVGPYRDGPGRLDPAVGEVRAIYVDPAAWRTGIGRALLAAGLAALSGRGWREVRLWVLEANESARLFYHHTGFFADGARAGHPIQRPDGSVIELTVVRYTRLLG
jgi:GNAT superfamily N-acetyltransferase